MSKTLGMMGLRGMIDAAALVVLGLVAVGCKKPLSATVKAEVLQVQRFGDGKAPGLMDLEIKFDCPGDARRLMRLDKTFDECAGDFKAGDKLDIEVESIWSSDKGSYRTEVKRIGNCPVKLDAKEEANYEMVQVCTDLKASGVTVGVTCDRTRPPELLAACPFLRRK